MNFLVINGPNLNLLGLREPAIYGKDNYETLISTVEEHAKKIGITVEIFQSNYEGAIVDEIQDAYQKVDGIIINPAAYTHTSIAILDALKAVAIPAVEVHLSKVEEREAFRQISYAGLACVNTITGKGIEGYVLAMDYLKNYISQNEHGIKNNSL